MLNPNEHILALDFDGVIGNSVHECLVVSFNAFYYPNQGIIVKSVAELDANLVREFTRIRNYIRSGADFMYILMALRDNIVISGQQDFDDYTRQHSELHDKYFKDFYRVRETLSVEHFDLWLELNPFYEGMGEYLAGYPVKDSLYIITTKKIEYVIKLLSYHHIELVEGNLFTADKNKGKRQVLMDIMTKHRKSPDKVWYIDDQIDTLLKIYDSGVRCQMALWGYNNAEQLGTAEKANIPALTLDKFRKLFDYTA